ncbi:MAG: hypothetical protein J6R54_09235 [Bacteroidaceae bacterium]|nr:hypothetical protein [Bacteroidaceae bacterium]
MKRRISQGSTAHNSLLNATSTASAAKVVNDFENPKLSDEKNSFRVLSDKNGKKTLVDNEGIRFRISNDNQEIFVSNARFNEELEKLNEENADSIILSLGRPSDILISAGVEDKPMKLYGNKVIKKMKKNGFAISELFDLPSAVADPIAVFDNIGRKGNRSVLTELVTANGNFLVALDLGKEADIDFNIVTSAFGRGFENILDWIKRGYATYINKKKALSFLSHQSAPIAAAAAKEELDSAAKVIKDFRNPCVGEGIKFSISGNLRERYDKMLQPPTSRRT